VRIADEVQPAIAPVNGPAGGLVTAKQAFLVELGIGPGTVELVATVDNRAQAVTDAFTGFAHQLLERGDNIHTFGNQRHRGRPNVVIHSSHHDLHRSP
jgi:hypothetical protein